MAEITDSLSFELSSHRRPGPLARLRTVLARTWTEARTAVAAERQLLRMEQDFWDADPRVLRDIGLDRRFC